MHFGHPQLPNYSTILRGTFKEHLGLAAPPGVDILSLNEKSSGSAPVS